MEALCKGSWLLGTACGECQRCREDAIPALRRLLEDRRWRPIETAPRSGPAGRRHVLVRGPSNVLGTVHFVVKAYHDAHYRPLDPWRMINDGTLSDLGWRPTEWRELL